MRIIQFILLAILAIAPGSAFAAEAGNTQVRALLVILSTTKGESDARLSAYEPNLRRVLRFESSRLVGEGSVSLSSPGKSSLNLAQGHSLALENHKGEAGGMRLQISWQEHGRLLMNTAVVPRRGVPVVLGGPATGKGGEVWAVIVIAD